MAKASKSWKSLSRIDWVTKLEKDKDISDERIQLGAILRIADAAELMAKNHRALTEELDRYKRWRQEDIVRIDKLERRIAALRGYITRLKKK